MKEFIDKLIGRLEERKLVRVEQCHDDYEIEIMTGSNFDDAIQIVNQLAGEYINCSTDTSTDCSKCSRRSWYQKGYTDAEKKLAEEYKLFGNSEQVNNGWIPCSERLPELTEGTECFKQSPCCLVTLKWWDGDMTESIGWYNQSGVWNEDSKNCKVIAWQPLPSPYQPKGE